MERFRNLYSTGTTAFGRSVLAFLVAPLLSCILVISAVMFHALWTMPEGRIPLTFTDFVGNFLAGVILGTFFVGGILTYLGMVLVGIPTWLLLRLTGNESGLAYSIIGLTAGWLIGPALGGHKWEGFPLNVAGAAGGGLALFIFWRIARRR